MEETQSPNPDRQGPTSLHSAIAQALVAFWKRRSLNEKRLIVASSIVASILVTGMLSALTRPENKQPDSAATGTASYTASPARPSLTPESPHSTTPQSAAPMPKDWERGPEQTPKSPGNAAPSQDEQARAEILELVEQVLHSPITYAKLKKNSSPYRGMVWGFTGKILEIYEQDGATIARVGVGPWGTDPVFVKGKFTTPLVENDRCYVVGKIDDDYTYESQAGWNISIPSVFAVAMGTPAEGERFKAAARKAIRAGAK
jgi:hypothetical protein